MLGKYIRLSDQDVDCQPGEKLESNSIVNQRALLDHFIANDPELASQKAVEFIDDGRTGTNFDRPGVRSMLAAVKCGEIDCIIVKDLSRFGRDSLEAGEYLERVFPLLQVRFIAINDGYDSRNKQYGAAGDLDIGVRNLMNELYSQDISKKVMTAKKQCAERGEYIAAYSFYGYAKEAENRRRLIPDTQAAEVVRKIFGLWLEGNSVVEIAAALNREGIPSPSMRKRQLGVKRTSWSSLREDVPWTNRAVQKILRDERYTGKMISLRTMRKELGKTAPLPLPKEQWIVVPNAFEPIISEEMFRQAQSRFRVSPPRSQSKQADLPPPMFTRKVRCSECGLGLVYQRAKRPYYKCAAWRNELPEHCKKIRIYEDDLKAAVLAEIHTYAKQHLNATVQVDSTAEQELRQAQLSVLKQKIEKEWTAKKDAFIKRNDGLMSLEEYALACQNRQREIRRLQGEIDKLSDVTQTYMPNAGNTGILVKAAEAAELTPDMVNALVHSIRVFENQRIEIVWNN